MKFNIGKSNFYRLSGIIFPSNNFFFLKSALDSNLNFINIYTRNINCYSLMKFDIGKLIILLIISRFYTNICI